MNKLLKLTLVGALSLSLFACGNKNKPSTDTKDDSTTVTPVKKEEVKILTPSGTPLMAIGGLIGTDGVNIEAVNGPENLVAGLSKGEYDIIVAPLTAGAKLSIAGKSKYKLEAVVTTNNTYIMAKGTTTLTNISDLSGKKVIAYGQNNTPDIALKNALKNNDIEDADITYETDVTTAMSTFMGGSDYDYCLIAEPQISKIKNNGANIKTLDLSNYMSTTIYQAGIFVNPNANQTRCDEVISDIKTNITYLNANPTEYAEKVESKNQFFTTMTKEVLALSIPNANISFIKAKDNKDNIKAYFTEVNNYNAAILNGMVTDEFFR